MDSSHLAGRRILVVDDVVANRVLLKRFLTGKGFEVDEAGSGAEAVALSGESNYDLILMDVMMEDMNGMEAAGQIKRSKEQQQIHLPIIFVTALNSQDAYVDAMAQGGDDFISKPIIFPVLEAKISAHLRIGYLYQQLESRNAELKGFNQYLNHERNVVQHLLDDAYHRNRKPACCIRDHLAPVEGFNGDILLGDLGPGGLYYLMLGDFTGHGLVAAIGTFPVKQTFFQLSEAGVSLGDMARGINKHLRDFLPPEIFCAAILLQLDIYSGRLLVWNGAMPDAYVIDHDGRLQHQLRSQHMPLGILGDEEFDPYVEVIDFPADAHLYLHTDGLNEMTDAEGVAFGEQRVLALLSSPFVGRFERLMAANSSFRPGLPQEDDIALVEIDFSQATCMVERSSESPQGQERQPEPVPPFRVEMTLGPEEMRRLEPVNLCSSMLAQQPGLRPHKDIIHTLIAELYNNALEHSVLGLGHIDKSDTLAFLNYYREREKRLAELSEAQISVAFTLLSDERGELLEMRLKDSGCGFDAENCLSRSRSEAHSGRGLALLEQFGERLQYSADGREVQLLYRLG